MMAIAWQARSADEDPVCYLQQWRVMETSRGTRHFIGRNRLLDTGRASSPITSFDPMLGQGVTHSGRIYELVGQSGRCEKAALLWEIECQRMGVTSVDVSSEYRTISASD